MESTGPDGPKQPKRGKSRAGGKGRKGGKRKPVVRSHPVLIFMDPIPWRALKRRSPAQLQTMMLDQLTTRQQTRLVEARAAEAAAAAQLFPPPPAPVEVPAGPEPEPAPSAAAFHLSQDCLDAAHTAERAIAQAAAVRARQLDAARTHAQHAVMLGEDPTGATGEAFGKKVPKWTRSEIAFRGFTAMVAAELHITEAAAEKLITTSTTVIHTFPTMLALLEEGNTTWRHVESLVAHSYRVPEEYKETYEAALVGAAQEMTPSQFDRTARREADTYVDEALEVRHREAMTHRSLTLTPSEDGMADLHLHIDACDAVAIYNRATDIARGLKTPTEGRTLDLIRTDVATRLMREGITTTPGAPAPGEPVGDPTSVGVGVGAGAGGGKGLGVGIVATVALQVPVLRLLEDINAEQSPDAEPTKGGPGADTAELVGYGPISMDRARELMGTATSFTRILTHPETGTILSIGRKRYRVPAAMRLFLMVRDQTCRFPGCTVLARFCDIDHTKDWDDGGPTDTTNLAHVCESHHRLKHQTGWTYTQDENGVCTWVSPTGKTYITRPAKNITPPAAETLTETDGGAGTNTDRPDDNPTPPGRARPALPF